MADNENIQGGDDQIVEVDKLIPKTQQIVEHAKKTIRKNQEYLERRSRERPKIPGEKSDEALNSG